MGISENGATRTTPANPICGDRVTKCSATAVATAVPRLWPTRTICPGGIFAMVSAQSSNVMPSVISPSSVGVPVEYPKPR